VLSQVLAADVNVGYEDIVNTQVGVGGWRSGRQGGCKGLPLPLVSMRPAWVLEQRAFQQEPDACSTPCALPQALSYPWASPLLIHTPLPSLQVLKVNGQTVNNLKDLVAAVEGSTGQYLELSLEYNQVHGCRPAGPR
jgi:hypothetical protein